MRNILSDAPANLGALTVAMLGRNAKLVSYDRYGAPAEALLHNNSMLMRRSALAPVAQVGLAASVRPLPHELVNLSERYFIRNLATGYRIGTQEKSAN